MALRRIVFTQNNWTEESKYALLKEPAFSYVIVGEEVAPTTGTRHLQGYAEFVRKQRFTALSKRHLNMHCEMAKTQKEAIEYCKKDGIFEERGTPRGTEPTDDTDKWTAIIELAVKGSMTSLLETYPRETIRYYNTLKQIGTDQMRPLPDIETLDNYWICGAPGSGKTLLARQMANNVFYPKTLNKWWDGYQGQDWVIIDDWEINSKLDHHIKIWADHYDFLAEVKGGTIRIRPKHIIVTSNYSINDCFIELNLNKAVTRRFKVINKE